MGHRTLKALEDSDLPDSCTIGEAKVLIQNEIKEQENQRVVQDELVVNKFNGTYLKRIAPDKLFGDTLEVIQVTGVKPETYTTDWERTFGLKGRIITFDRLHIHSREFSEGNVSASYTEKTLDTFQVIDETEFLLYVVEYNKINSTLQTLLAENK